jgi:hypothetical protein
MKIESGFLEEAFPELVEVVSWPVRQIASTIRWISVESVSP